MYAFKFYNNSRKAKAEFSGPVGQRSNEVELVAIREALRLSKASFLFRQKEEWV